MSPCPFPTTITTTPREGWMIGMEGERESGKSVLAVRLDVDDGDIYHTYICLLVCLFVCLVDEWGVILLVGWI